MMISLVLLGDLARDVVGGESEAVGLVAFDENALAARVVHHVFVSDPIGNRDDHFVAVLNQRLHQIEDRVLAADCYQALRGRVSGAVIVMMPRANGLLHLDGSAGGRVLGEVGVDGCDGRLLDVVGRREIGLTGAKIHDVDAFAAKLVGIGRNFHGGGLADERDALRLGSRLLS